MAGDLDVSRTVVRAALTRLSEQGIIVFEGRDKTVLRRSTPDDLMQEPPALLTLEQLEARFFDWILRMDVPPGTMLNVAQIAKDFHVATHTLQEFLSSLCSYGIVRRHPRGGWQLEGFTEKFALELCEFRSLLELNAVTRLVSLPPEHGFWKKLDVIEADHKALLSRIDTDFHDFSRLDETFHFTINAVVENRFVRKAQKIISLIFQYYFQWNKADERIRKEDAIYEHLAYINAIRSRDAHRALEAARSHLARSTLTLVKSLRAYDCAI